MSMQIQFRDNLRKFLSRNDLLIERIFKGIMAFVCFMIINANFGYSSVLNSLWLPLVVAVLCAFVPGSALSLVVIVYWLIHLASLQTDIALVAALLFGVAYAFTTIYQGSIYYNVIGIPLAYPIRIPYVLPVQSALLGKSSEVITVICGSVIAYYLKSVKEHAAQIIDSQSSVSVSDILMDGMLSNTMFYVFLTAMVAAFLVTYVLRCSTISNAWLLGSLAGVSVEFIILLAGYLILNRGSQIPFLIIGNLVTLASAFVSSYLFFDLDYTRTEKVQFEDDDYYYYVTAVPKVKIEKEAKEIKKITEGNPSARNAKMNFSEEKKDRKEVTEVE